MIYSVNFLDLTEQISPKSFVKYLKDSGWTQFNNRRAYIAIMQNKDSEGNDFQVTIPLERELIDYKQAMYDAITVVASFEKQSTEQLMLYLLNPSTDILKIRLDRKDIEIGNILFDDAIHFFENAKKLIAAAALDVLHPKKYHIGRTDGCISEFINNCRFGQTEIGSYVISVVCPFAELNDEGEYRQLTLFSDESECADSLTRKVTNKIMTNIAYIKTNIENGNPEKLVLDSEDPNVISANFYEALSGLNLNVENSNVEFIAKWSPAVKTNRCDVSQVTLSNKDHFDSISGAIDKLKEEVTSQKILVGKVTKLTSTPDIEKRTSGEITLIYVDDRNKAKKLSIKLGNADYDKAIEAHHQGKSVMVAGTIKGKGKAESMNCESFEIIDEQY